jgi:hypothetical protein
MSDSAGSKQVEASFSDLHLQLAFTGVASDSSGTKTIDWLKAELEALPHDASATMIFEALQKVSANKMAPFGAMGVLILVLAIAEFRKPFRIAQITNASLDKGKTTLVAKPRFEVRVRTITRPFHLISGWPCVSAQDAFRLRALSKAVGMSVEEMRTELAAINSRAAHRSGGRVSEGCWITFQSADGQNRRTGAWYVGESTGEVPTLFHGMDLSKWLKENFSLPPGADIRLTPIGGVFGEGTPAPAPEGPPRTIKLSTSTVKASLRSESGEICASIEIRGNDCTIEARRNEQVTVLFGEFHLTGLIPDHVDFPKPRLPWATFSPTLSLDDTVVEKDFPYSIGYWIENARHRVRILRSSHTIRNVSFLGTDDQLVLGVPASEAEFSWSFAEEGPTAAFQATLMWQVRTP